MTTAGPEPTTGSVVAPTRRWGLRVRVVVAFAVLGFVVVSMLAVTGVKIYNDQGVVVFSTNPAQIGTSEMAGSVGCRMGPPADIA